MRIKYGLFFLLFICMINAINAAHIIGGDVVYNCIKSDTFLKRTDFEITFTMYRDSKGNGANFDQGASFGLYKSTDNGQSWVFVENFNVNPRDIRDVPYANPCIIVPPNIGVERATYQFNISLDWGNAIYQVAYQRCCRNGTITNIVAPGSTGAAFVVEIYGDAIQTCNNSPKFKNFPPTVICVNTPLNFDHAATDKEGDQLVYEFCNPLTAGGRDGDSGVGDPNGCTGVRPSPSRCSPPFQMVNFLQPSYSASSPVPGEPPLMIDPVSGVITGIPNQSGQFVVGVCVKEFRNGKLIGTIRRDFQFNATQCQIAVDAIIEIESKKIKEGYVEVKRTGNTFNIKSCGSLDFPFVNKSIQESNIKGYKWIINNAGKSDSFNTKEIDYSFKTLGKQSGLMIVNPGLTNCSDTAFLNIEIFPSLKADFTYAYDTCVAQPVNFMDKSTAAVPINKYEWFFEKDTLRNQNPIYEFRTPGEKKVKLKITDSNGCINTNDKEILYQPVPALITLEPTQFIACKPGTIVFQNLSYPIDSTYKIEWNFGDGKTSGDISPTHTYDTIGLFDVSLRITSPIGCTTFNNYKSWIEILKKPTAEFSYTPQEFTGLNKTATFTNLSQDEISVLWDFGKSGSTTDENPIYSFPDTGLFKVILYAVHENGCIDTAFADIDIMPIASLDMPNAFTPNNDGLNDDFKGFGNFEGASNYKLTVWNRWGDKIFESTNPLQGWTGEKDNDGLLAPQDVYLYIVDFITPRGEPKKIRGHVTLIR